MKPVHIRRADRIMTLENLREHPNNAQYCVISTIDDQGNPYGVPLSYVFVEGEHNACDTTISPEAAQGIYPISGVLYVHMAKGVGKKLACFTTRPQACATIVEDVVPFFRDGNFSTSYASAMLFGNMREVTDIIEVRKALVALCMKYLPEHKKDIGAAMDADIDHTAVWALEISYASGKERNAQL